MLDAAKQGGTAHGNALAAVSRLCRRQVAAEHRRRQSPGLLRCVARRRHRGRHAPGALRVVLARVLLQIRALVCTHNTRSWPHHRRLRGRALTLEQPCDRGRSASDLLLSSCGSIRKRASPAHKENALDGSLAATAASRQTLALAQRRPSVQATHPSSAEHEGMSLSWQASPAPQAEQVANSNNSPNAAQLRNIAFRLHPQMRGKGVLGYWYDAKAGNHSGRRHHSLGPCAVTVSPACALFFCSNFDAPES